MKLSNLRIEISNLIILFQFILLASLISLFLGTKPLQQEDSNYLRFSGEATAFSAIQSEYLEEDDHSLDSLSFSASKGDLVFLPVFLLLKLSDCVFHKIFLLPLYTDLPPPLL